ncbi:RNA dependent RNA polymerase-domain-containing protein [Cercophora scortea]|uniref:RNA-dependent RNA polymerase n=1 Tax=Cercophora scortea TaxID=314031 RepID=A0AAE0IAD8_9PEZI|nr:RNA dependent RNA polymerase-domain-containing protein [Cercophora scortea]
MEVFLRNLPLDLTDRSLQNQLEPFMKQLSIKYYDPVKHKRKTTGTITFVFKADGEKFLDRHGEQPQFRKSTRSRLSIMNKDVFCSLSRKQPKPEDLALKGIKHEIDQREARRDVSHQDPAVEFSASCLSCGHHKFVDGRMVFTAEWMTTDQHCSVKFTKRTIIINATSKFLHVDDDIQVRIPFQSIVELVWSQNGDVFVTLSRTPIFILKMKDISAIMLKLGLQPGPEIPLSRRVDAISEEHRAVSNFCLVYHFKAPSGPSFHDKITKLKRKDLFPVTSYDCGFQRLHAPTSTVPSLDRAVSLLKEKLDEYGKAGSLPFGLLFQLQALVYNGYLHPTTVLALARRLAAVFSDARSAGSGVPPISVDAFKKLFNWIDYPSPQGNVRQFEVDGIMEYLDEVEKEMREGFAVRSELVGETQNLTRIYRAYVTPTRITLHGPEFEAKNRILRKFPDHQDHFLRVQFSDEDGQDLFFNSKVSLEPIYSRFKSVLGNGISIAGRVYKFLGFSHSSLRAHSVWLSAPFFYAGKLQVPDFIITSLGDFNKIRSPARRAARIGQAFSETPYAIPLDDNEILVSRIDDVEYNDRVFSDGVGTISRGAMEAIHGVMPQSKGYPTCFQIRWAGAKGMLALDPRLPGNQFCIRPSMEKFPSSDKLNLEICDVASKPIPLVLNRQLVKIMEDMGAPERWFFELQDRELKRLRGITSDVYNTASFLKLQSIGEAIQLHKFFRQTDSMDVDYRRDPFLRAVVEVVVLKELRLLKHKARIPIRQGMTLFGIMDETGFLEEGQVYLNYDTMGDRHEEPPGRCAVIVTRSPALHPGDVQVAQHVTPPDGHPLTELWNCIVFSQKGERDLPSQLSGGDLDGDVFNVIWDSDVVDYVSTFEPANYPRVQPLELDRPVVARDMADFFIDFMKTDHLGVIATRHMAMADQEPEGTLDIKCIELAELHSRAVDFSKTGHPVEMIELPKCEHPKWRPDFLARGPVVTIHDKSAIEMDQYTHQDDEEDEDNEDGPRHKFYRSDKLLGGLYRAIDEENIWAEDIKQTVPTGGASFWDELITGLHERVKSVADIRWEPRLEEAHRIRHAYEDAILSVMVECSDHPHQPLRELEVFVGFIFNKTGSQTSRQRDRSIKLKDEFERIAGWIMRQMREPVSPGGLANNFDALQLCLACVHAGCIKEDMAINSWTRNLGQNIESFRIVAASALMRELNAIENGIRALRNADSGGYVGVSGRPAPSSTHQNRGPDAAQTVATATPRVVASDLPHDGGVRVSQCNPQVAANQYLLSQIGCRISQQ